MNNEVHVSTTMKMFGFPSTGGQPIGFDPFTQIGLAASIEVVCGSLLLSIDALIASSGSAGAGEGGVMRLHLAELLLAVLFVAGGFSTLRDPKPRAAQIARLGFPFADLSVRVNATLMVVAGIALAVNYHAAGASALLAILLLPTTVFGHAFWLEKGHDRQVQLSHFIKNLGVLAALLLLTLAAD